MDKYQRNNYYMEQHQTDGLKENKFSYQCSVQHPTNASQPEIVEVQKT